MTPGSWDEGLLLSLQISFSQMTISVPVEANSLTTFFFTMDRMASGTLGPSIYYIWHFEIIYKTNDNK